MPSRVFFDGCALQRVGRAPRDCGQNSAPMPAARERGGVVLVAAAR